MAQMDGQTDHPRTPEQKRQNAAYAEALRFAREEYKSEARIVEMIDKTRAADNDAQRWAPPGALWHALVALDDGRHAVIGVRDQSARGEGGPQVDQDTRGPQPTRDSYDEGDAGVWGAFEVGAPTLGDPQGT